MNEKGFSLIELMVVVAIIGIVATIAIPNYVNSRKSANETKAIGYLRSWSSAQELYRRSNGNYATADEDLVIDGYVGKGLASDGTADDNAFTYTIDSEASDYPRWFGRAIRRGVHTAYRSFYIDQSGVLRARADAEDADETDPPASK